MTGPAPARKPAPDPAAAPAAGPVAVPAQRIAHANAAAAPTRSAAAPAHGLGPLAVQMQPEEEEEEELLQAACDCGADMDAAGDDDPPGPGGFQMDGPGSAPAVSGAHAVAAAGVSGAADPLPHADRIQSAFGRHDIGDIRTRTGGKAEEASRSLGARAYTRQRQIAFRAAPSLRLAAHEAAHTVQQRRGVELSGGIGRPGDPYERQADEAAEAVVRGDSAEAILDADPGKGPGTPSPSLQRDCGCGGTCASCRAGAAEEDEEDPIQMELSVTDPPGGAAEAEPGEEPQAPGPALDEVAETSGAAEREDPEAEVAEAGESGEAAPEPAPDAAEAGAETMPAGSGAVPEGGAGGPGSRDGGQPARTADTAIPADETEANRAATASGDRTGSRQGADEEDEEETLQRASCGPTSEPEVEEEPAEPPPGEVQETAEAEGPAPEDEAEDPGAMQDAIDGIESGEAATEAAGPVGEADPAAAEAATREAGTGGGGAAAPSPALAQAGAALAGDAAQVVATRAGAVDSYAGGGESLAAARAAAAALPGLPVAFDARGQDRGDLDAATAQLAGRLSRASGSITAAVDGIEAQIESRTAAALAEAIGGVEAASAAAQGAVLASIGAAEARTVSDAAAQRALVSAQADAAIAGIDAHAAGVLARVAAAEQVARVNITVAQAAQAGPITAAYATGERLVREAGREVGAEAMEIAATYEAAYRRDRKVDGSGCIEDSWYDGCLCDRRARARMTAARQVGEGYRDSLVDAAGEQADGMRQGMPTDFANVASLAAKATETAAGQATAFRVAIEARRDAAKAAVTAAKVTTIGEIDATEAGTLASLEALRASQIETLSELRFIQIATLEETAHAAAAAALQNAAAAVQSATTGVAGAVAGLTGKAPPPGDALADALAGLEAMLDGALQSLAASLDTALGGVAGRIAAQGAAAATALGEAADQGRMQAETMADSARTAVTTLGAATVGRIIEAMAALIRDAEAMATAAVTALTGIVTGLAANYATLVGNLATGFRTGAENLKAGLRDALGGMRTGENSIPTKAAEAASKEKPAWQSVLKWVLIIAIVIVVAVVAGPAVIGAIGGLATGLGASTAVAGFIGATVGGALLGAATGATIQVVNNVFDGNPWHEGVAKAAAVGFVTGALGGAVGFGISAAFTPVAQGAQAVTRTLGSRALEFGANLAADATMEIGQQLIETGGVDWANFGVAMAFSVGTAGLGEVPSVKAAQEAISGGVSRSVADSVSARARPDAPVRPDVDAGVKVGAEAEARGPETGRPAEPDAGPAATRPPDAEAEARTRAEADDAANPRVEDDGGISDSNLSDASARAADSPDAPRLDAEPDAPARERSDSELAEAAEPVRVDGEDHTLVPRRWIDGEVRLFLCTDCGPVLAKIDDMAARATDPDVRAALLELRAEVSDIETRVRDGGDTAEFQARIDEIANTLGRIPRLDPVEGPRPTRSPSDSEVLEGPAPRPDDTMPPDALHPDQTPRPDSTEAALAAGLPTELVHSGTVVTHADLPNFVTDGLPPRGRTPPDALDPAGRTVSNSAAQNAEMQADILLAQAHLRAAGGDIVEVRVDQEQVSGMGEHVGRNRPDLQLTTITAELNGRRIYIEYDRAPPTRAIEHAQRILQNDPDAIIILKVIDFDPPWLVRWRESQAAQEDF